MKHLIFIGLACVLMVQAKPHLDERGYRQGLGHESGREYGNQGFGGGIRGYQNEGQQRAGSSHGHDRGYKNDDYTQVTNSHHSSGHDVGADRIYNEGGHRAGGHDQYQRGQSEHGQEYNRGFV